MSLFQISSCSPKDLVRIFITPDSLIFGKYTLLPYSQWGVSLLLWIYLFVSILFLYSISIFLWAYGKKINKNLDIKDKQEQAIAKSGVLGLLWFWGLITVPFLLTIVYGIKEKEIIRFLIIGSFLSIFILYSCFGNIKEYGLALLKNKQQQGEWNEDDIKNGKYDFLYLSQSNLGKIIIAIFSTFFIYQIVKHYIMIILSYWKL